MRKVKVHSPPECQFFPACGLVMATNDYLWGQCNSPFIPQFVTAGLSLRYARDINHLAKICYQTCSLNARMAQTHIEAGTQTARMALVEAGTQTRARMDVEVGTQTESSDPRTGLPSEQPSSLSLWRATQVQIIMLG
jgi:hypothetical protein